MKDRRALGESLKIPFLIHNLALTIGSGALLAVMLEEVLPILNRGGALYGICHPAAWTTVSRHTRFGGIETRFIREALTSGSFRLPSFLIIR